MSTTAEIIVGIELNPTYADIAQRRIQKELDKGPTLW